MSIQLQLRVSSGTPIYRGHDHYWSAIRDLGKFGQLFTFHDVDMVCNDRDGEAIGEFLRRLQRAGFLEVVETKQVSTAGQGPTNQKTFRQRIYRLLKRPTATPIINRDGSMGKQGRGQEQIWNAIRALKTFETKELTIAAGTDEVSISRETVQTYVVHLESAGYLQALRRGKGRTPGIWRLKPSMNTGPKAPKILRSKMVYDVNRKEIMGRPVAEECVA
ncbi:hypothetical protein [Labrenzia sp. CE80]|uniref:hypothetical protein n=1 Tax=Labrenzia sp. CE80 TaxID=1788986 RepID=UPI00129A3FE6|nr:hypothetical protein [Labrenzia sp. CE80]